MEKYNVLNNLKEYAVVISILCMLSLGNAATHNKVLPTLLTSLPKILPNVQNINVILHPSNRANTKWHDAGKQMLKNQTKWYVRFIPINYAINDLPSGKSSNAGPDVGEEGGIPFPTPPRGNDSPAKRNRDVRSARKPHIIPRGDKNSH